MTSSNNKICLIGVGAIGISFAALYIRHSAATISIYDPRSDLEEHVRTVLPGYIDSADPAFQIDNLQSQGRLVLCKSLEEACKDASIVQEQGPERPDFKQNLWPQVERLVGPNTQLWSSTSGIAASIQSRSMIDKTQLLVVHPFNPPHVMPLIEIVPSPDTAPAAVEFARNFFVTLGSGHRPVVIHKEVPGFVGNRLAFTLFREACSLVHSGVITAQDVDTLIEASLGPRWAVQGPFKSYNMGGSSGGLAAFLKNLGGTMQDIWNDARPINFGEEMDKAGAEGWQEVVIRQTDQAYGKPDPTQYRVRDEALRRVLDTQGTKSV